MAGAASRAGTSGHSNIQLLVAEVAALKERLTEVQDRQEIIELLNRMARGFDRHDFDLVLSTWHPDGVEEHGNVAGPIIDFVEYTKTYLPNSYRTHSHYVANHVIDIDGDVAHFETYTLAAVLRRYGDATEMFGGRYVGRAERRDGKWGVHRTTLGEWGGALTPLPGWETKTMDLGKGSWDKSDPSYRR